MRTAADAAVWRCGVYSAAAQQLHQPVSTSADAVNLLLLLLTT
jgi:hypothetical protein